MYGSYLFILPRAIIAMAAQQTEACVQLSLVTARPGEGRACQDAAFHLGSPDTNRDSALEQSFLPEEYQLQLLLAASSVLSRMCSRLCQGARLGVRY